MNIIHIDVLKGCENVNIKHIRLKCGMNQEQLADKLGVDRSTIAKWETGEAMPRSDKLPLLAETLNCSIADLFAERTN